jgi:hypothetical protein
MKSPRTRVLGISILVGHLLVASRAFVPPSIHPVKLERPTSLRSTLSDKDADQKQSPFPIKVVKTSFNKVANHNSNDNKNCLELDSVGRLRLCNSPDVLLQGLDPQTWSATRPVSGKTNSLFLHTSHPESLPEHQTSLGSLISCRRLIACARKYLAKVPLLQLNAITTQITNPIVSNRLGFVPRTKPLLDGPQNRSQRRRHSL